MKISKGDNPHNQDFLEIRDNLGKIPTYSYWVLFTKSEKKRKTEYWNYIGATLGQMSKGSSVLTRQHWRAIDKKELAKHIYEATPQLWGLKLIKKCSWHLIMESNQKNPVYCWERNPSFLFFNL